MKMAVWLSGLLLLFAVACSDAEKSSAVLTIDEPKDGATVTTRDLTIRGTASPGAEIHRDIRFSPDDKFNADASGKWEYRVDDLEEGDHSFEFFLQNNQDTRAKLTVTYRPQILPLATANATRAPTAAPTIAPTPAPTPAPTAAPIPRATLAPAPTPGGGGGGAPAGATAIWNDGTYSYSQHRRGTCSHHGGVAQWLVDLPP